MEKMAKKGMAALVGLALISAAGLAQAETRFAVQDTNGADRMVVTDTGFVGIGTNNPGTAVEIQGAPGSVGSRMLMRTMGTSAAGGGGVISLHNNAATVNNSFPQGGDRLGFYLFGTKNGANNVTSAGIEALAAANWSIPATGAAVVPSYMRFVTGGAVRMTIDTNGNVGFGTGNPTQRLEVNGGIRLNTTAARPSCAAATRGVLYFTQSATGDTLEVCARDAAGNDIWRPLF